MNTPDEFSRYYAELIEGRYDCVDRLVVNAYFPMGQTGGGMRSWWRRWRGDDSELDDAHLRDLAGTFSRRVRGYCEKHGIPLVETKAGERKHELAEEHLPTDPGFQGLFLVITGNAPAPVWEVKRTADGRILDLHHRKSWPYVKHYYFHLIDAEWGHVTIRMCGYPPFGAQVILNGHEWVERQARRQRLTVSKASNCFVEGSDFEAVNRLAETLHEIMAQGSLKAVCDRWIYSSCLCFVLDREAQEHSGFVYQYSVFQLELSRNLLFHRGATLDEVYQKLIDRARQPLDVKQLKTIFGRTHRPFRIPTRGRDVPKLVKAVQTPSYDLTVFKLHWGHLTLKLYDKGERVLRAEVVVHNSKDLRCGKVLDKLPVMLERMGGMLVRFLDTVQVAHISFLDEGTFDQWCEPTTRGTRRLAGIDLNKARNRTVVDAVVGLATRPDGFTLAQLAETVRQRSGWPVETYSSRHAAYDLAKLRGKQLVLRSRGSRRYQAEPAGVRTMCAYLLLREQVIKPLLAGITRKPGRPPAHPHPLDRHYVALREELQRTFETIGLAA
ncbi:hypothetical protein [Methyloterricola oryzae]|uniref:hypothetical protein n=1 Tax=Methyloterricola oryzae TaxID=1495050 RepID=UPI0005EBCB81|nr:hypothetical protein [Methyloterricola oryzae]